MLLASRRTSATMPPVTELWAYRCPGEDHRYSWLEHYLRRLDGKEARQEYYARLEQVEYQVGTEHAALQSPSPCEHKHG